jgi:hypothetical protein
MSTANCMGSRLRSAWVRPIRASLCWRFILAIPGAYARIELARGTAEREEELAHDAPPELIKAVLTSKSPRSKS